MPTSLMVNSERAFLVDMHFTGGFSHVVAITSTEATNTHEACRVAERRFEYLRHLEDWDLKHIHERLGMYGQIDRLAAYRDTDESRRMLGVEGAEVDDIGKRQMGWDYRMPESERISRELMQAYRDRYQWLSTTEAQIPSSSGMNGES